MSDQTTADEVETFLNDEQMRRAFLTGQLAVMEGAQCPYFDPKLIGAWYDGRNSMEVGTYGD